VRTLANQQANKFVAQRASVVAIYLGGGKFDYQSCNKTTWHRCVAASQVLQRRFVTLLRAASSCRRLRQPD
jgi:hypothetical protein